MKKLCKLNGPQILREWVSPHPDLLAGGLRTADTINPLLTSLEGLYTFLRTDAPVAGTWMTLRDQFLDAWHATGESVLTRAMHYITNHLWEDSVTWGSLHRFLGEAGEASHARDNRQKKPTLRGRQKCGRDACGSFTMLLRNFCMAKTLEVDGISAR